MTYLPDSPPRARAIPRSLGERAQAAALASADWAAHTAMQLVRVAALIIPIAVLGVLVVALAFMIVGPMRPRSARVVVGAPPSGVCVAVLGDRADARAVLATPPARAACWALFEQLGRDVRAGQPSAR